MSSAQKTSIHLGSDRTNYSTESNDASSRLTQDVYSKSKTNFGGGNQASCLVLGNERLSYNTSNRLADPTGNMSKYTAVQSDDAKKALRQSNLSLGNAGTTYKSTSADANKYDVEAVRKNAAMGDQSKAFKETLAKRNFDLGDEKTDYRSEYASAHQHDPSQVQRTTAGGNTADLRSSHFSFGSDRPQYSTSNGMPDTTSAIRSMHNNPEAKPTPLAAQTHIEIGQ